MERSQWLIERRKGIGGSDSPVILLGNVFGKKPIDIAIEKLGAPMVDEETGPIKRGRYMEPHVAEMWAEKTGKKIRKSKEMAWHPQHKFIFANMDYDVIGDPRGLGFMDVKCPGFMNYRKIKQYGLPHYMIVQGQHYLSFPEYQWGSFAIFSTEYWEMITVDIDPDLDLQNRIIEVDREFWASIVLSGKLPEESVEPFELPDEEGEVTTMNTPEFIEALVELKEASEIYDDAGELKKAAQEDMKTLMGDNGVVEGGDEEVYARVYHKHQKGSLTFQKARFVVKHPDIKIDKFYKRGKGSRPFKVYFK